MLEALRRLPLARTAEVALVATIVFVVCGSSNVAELVRIGSKLRWVALAVFAVVAVAWALAERKSRRVTAPHVMVFALCALGVASAFWSVAPRLTLGRAASLAIVVAAAAATAAAVGRDRASAERIARAVVAATVLVSVAGVVVYLADPSRGAQAAVLGTPFRWRGMGLSANTVPMLVAVAVPLCLWLAWSSAGRRRAVYGAFCVLLCAEIVASGSRSGLGAVCAALVVFALTVPTSGRRGRLVLLAGSVVAAAALVGGVIAMVALTALPFPPPAPSSVQPGPVRYPRVVLPSLEDELGGVPSGARGLFGKDGRAQALNEAFDQGSQRPVFGWGFGTEERVFIDRLAQFHAARPENTYLGLYLQLGALGVALFLALGVFLARWTVRTRSEEPARQTAIAGLAAAVAAGYALGLGQSYVYSAGNVATLSFWVAALLLATFVAPSWSRRSARLAGVGAVAALVVAVPLALAERSHARGVQLTEIRHLWQRVGGRIDGQTVVGFRRLAPQQRCLLYAEGQTPTAVELCFDAGRLVQAIDRTHGRFRAWTVQPFGADAAQVTVQPALLERTLRRLGAFGPQVGDGPGYLARRGRR